MEDDSDMNERLKSPDFKDYDNDSAKITSGKVRSSIQKQIGDFRKEKLKKYTNINGRYEKYYSTNKNFGWLYIRLSK